jgi:transposase
VVEQILHTPGRVAIITSPRQKSAPCPTCAIVSRRIHSRYQRMLRDLPWQGQPVALCVQARRFRCLNPAGTVNLIGHRCIDTRNSGWAHGSLCQSGNTGDLGPGLEGLGAGSSIRDGGAVIAVEVEEIVDLVVSREETLSLPG